MAELRVRLELAGPHLDARSLSTWGVADRPLGDVLHSWQQADKLAKRLVLVVHGAAAISLSQNAISHEAVHVHTEHRVARCHFLHGVRAVENIDTCGVSTRRRDALVVALGQGG
jgi:hypothetical protein